MFGLEVQGLTGELWNFAVDELADLRRLVEKISALGGDPTLDVAPMHWTSDPAETIQHLIESEDEAIAALHEVIPPSGQEPRSEALEHLMEHLIMRKQNQVDWLRRAAREPNDSGQFAVERHVVDVVLPAPVDAQIVAREPLLTKPSFSSTRIERLLRGITLASTRCSPSGPKAMSKTSARSASVM